MVLLRTAKAQVFDLLPNIPNLTNLTYGPHIADIRTTHEPVIRFSSGRVTRNITLPSL